MKRFWAAVIDYFLCCIICIVILGLIWDVFRTEIVWGYNFKRMYYLISDFVYFIYSVLFDSLCRGNTPGKDLAGYKLSVSEDNMTVGWIVKHALCRTIAMRLSIPSAAYCITIGKMPYDRMLGIGCKDKISEIMEQKSKSVEDLKIRKRLAAGCIWPISLVYLLVTGRMFYDEGLKLEVMLEQ